MGNSTSKVLSDIGSLIGNVIATPFKSVFGRSCQDVCDGRWDVVCFVEHICVADLVKFLLACCLLYICLIFVYLLYKLGLCQCIAKTLCKLCWAVCETSCLTLDYICCFCWHKIRYTKRVYRGRRRRLRRQLSRDVELGYISTSSSSADEGGGFNDYGSSLGRKRKSWRETRRRRRMNHGKSVRLKKGQVSVHLKGKSRRRRRRRRRDQVMNEVQMSSLRKSRRSNTMKFKKQRTR
ncbi:uncharacterized protein [Spinacia oleracea]|uniref:Uncharacterized protein n=1 Tax=Spinacia oleracea TaxID=3562 RepID=A0ABM3QZS4_SPIOL|nr:uncharacterized protein LOC130463699 [Spinacia oleracea]